MNIWKEYSISYLKKNKTASISIVVAAFISSLLLSLTCGIFYNIWTDEIRLIKLEEGDWQVKIAAALSEQDLETLENHPNVKKVVPETGQDGQRNTTLLYFHNQRKIYKDMPKLAKQLDLPTEDNTAIIYHEKLLNQYFIFSPEEGKKPPLVLLIYLFTLILTSLSLILIIHNAFGVSMDARLHQMGILQSIGATPKQLRFVLTTEAFVLSLLPILIGVTLGVGLCYGFMSFINNITGSVRKYDLIFMYHPIIYFAALAVSIITVWISARIPAKKISRMNPLEAIRYGKETPVRKMKRFFILSHLFGIEGELARKSLYIRRRAFRTSTVSLTISFLVFSAFLNLETISRISTKYTFFERYKDKWDLMLTITDNGEQNQKLIDDIRAIPGVESCIAYRKEATRVSITPSMVSDELTAIGGIEALKGSGIKMIQDNYQIDAPLFLLDNVSFERFRSEIGVNPEFFTADKPAYSILINTVWDNTNSTRKNKLLLPFIKEQDDVTLQLEPVSNEQSEAGDPFPVRIAATTDKLPNIREEAPDFSLLQIMSNSSYQKTAMKFNTPEYNYNIMANTDEDISVIDAKIRELLADQSKYTLENRFDKVEANVKFRNAYIIVIGSLAGLLVIIGLANIFSNTLGHIQQRKKELARYLTIGLSPKGVKQLLLLEASVLAIKPILISLVVNIPLVIFALRTSLIPSSEFLHNIPLLPIVGFALVILLSVALAYYIAGRKIIRTDLIDVLKDETMI